MRKKIVIIPTNEGQYREIVETKNEKYVPISDAFYCELMENRNGIVRFKNPTYLFLLGGAGSGKSKTAALRELLDGLMSPKCITGLMVRKTQATISGSIYAEIKDWAVKLGLSDIFKFYDRSATIKNIKTGTVYYGRGMDKVGASNGGGSNEKIKSLKDLRRVIIEEASELSHTDIDMIFERLRANIGEKINVTMMFNPTNRAKHLKPIIKDLMTRYAHKGEAFAMYSYFMHNDFIDKESYAEQLLLKKLSSDEEYLMHIGTSKWVDEPNHNPFFKYFDAKKHVSDRAVFNPQYPLYFIMDFNYSEYACIVVQASHEDFTKSSFFHVIDEIVGLKCTDIEMAELIRAYAIRHNQQNRFYIGGDKSAEQNTTKGNSVAIMREVLDVGFDRALFRKVTKSKIELTNEIVEKSPKYIGLRKIHTHEDSRLVCNTVMSIHPDFIINPKCVRLIEDIKYARIKIGGVNMNTIQLHKEGGSGKEAQNFTDALRYAFNTLLPSYCTGDIHQFVKKWR